MLVDDDDGIRSYLRTILEREGLEVIEAADGIAALTVFERLAEAVDLLITDLRMPRMSGADLAFTIRTEFPDLPVIFVSSEPHNGRFHNSAQGLLYVEKPFRAQDIIDAVSQIAWRTASGICIMPRGNHP